MSVPTRTFSADVGDRSTGNAGPDAIETDIDAILAKLDGLLDDTNLAAGAATDTIIGNRTVDPALAGGANTGTITQLLSWMAKALAAVKGVAWTDAVAYSLVALKEQIDTVHKKTARFVIGTSTAGWTAVDCDYLCDGTADQVQINAAIAALPETGGEVVILDGTYNVSTRIFVRKNNVSIMGNGDATVLKRGWNADANNEYNPIVFCGKNNCLISNLAIDGNRGIYTASYNTNISIEGSNNILTNISANNCASNSVRVSGDFNKITCNKVIGNPNNGGIYLAGDFNIVCGNECRDNYTQINLNGANNNIITSNICIRGTGLPSDYGSSHKTINLFESTSNYNLIAMNNCMGKAVTNGGGTGNTLVNNKFDAT